MATQPRATAGSRISRPMAGRATFVADPMKGVRKDARVATTRTTRSFVRGGEVIASATVIWTWSMYW